MFNLIRSIILFLRKSNIYDADAFHCSVPIGVKPEYHGLDLNRGSIVFNDCEVEIKEVSLKITIKYLEKRFHVCREFCIYRNGMLAFFCRDQVQFSQYVSGIPLEHRTLCNALLFREIQVVDTTEDYVEFSVTDGYGLLAIYRFNFVNNGLSLFRYTSSEYVVFPEGVTPIREGRQKKGGA